MADGLFGMDNQTAMNLIGALGLLQAGGQFSRRYSPMEDASTSGRFRNALTDFGQTAGTGLMGYAQMANEAEKLKMQKAIQDAQIAHYGAQNQQITEQTNLLREQLAQKQREETQRALFGQKISDIMGRPEGGMVSPEGSYYSPEQLGTIKNYIGTLPTQEDIPAMGMSASDVVNQSDAMKALIGFRPAPDKKQELMSALTMLPGEKGLDIALQNVLLPKKYEPQTFEEAVKLKQAEKGFNLTPMGLTPDNRPVGYHPGTNQNYVTDAQGQLVPYVGTVKPKVEKQVVEHQRNKQFVGMRDGKALLLDPLTGSFSETPLPEGGAIIDPKNAPVIPSEAIKSLSDSKSVYDGLNRLEKNFDKYKDKLGPIEGRWTNIKTKLVNEPQSQAALNEMKSLIRIAYAFSGKQISEREIGMLQEAMLPNINQPNLNFMSTLRQAKTILEDSHNNALDYFSNGGYNTGRFKKLGTGQPSLGSTTGGRPPLDSFRR